MIGLSGTGVMRRSRAENNEHPADLSKSAKASDNPTEPKFKFFHIQQRATVALIASLIIPTDKDPGANEAGQEWFTT